MFNYLFGIILLSVGAILLAGGVLNLLPGKEKTNNRDHHFMGLFGVVAGLICIVFGGYSFVPPKAKPAKPNALAEKELDGFWYQSSNPKNVPAGASDLIHFLYFDGDEVTKGSFVVCNVGESKGELVVHQAVNGSSLTTTNYTSEVCKRGDSYYDYLTAGEFKCELEYSKNSLKTIETSYSSLYQKSSDFVGEYTRSQRSIPFMLALASYHLEEGKVSQAIALANRILEIDPNSWFAYELRSSANENNHKIDAAIVDLEQAISLSKNDPKAPTGTLYFRIGELKSIAGRDDDAISDFNNALETADMSRKADILCGRGLAYKNMGKLRESLADYDSAVQEDSNSVTALNRRAWLRATASDKSAQDPKRAIEDAKRAIELAGKGDANLLSTMAAAYALDDNFTAAINLQREAIQLDSEDASLQEMLHAFEAGQPWIENPDD